MKKYTAEQLSRILSSAAEGKLGSPAPPRDACVCDRRCCIEQAAHATGALGSWADRRVSDEGTSIWDMGRPAGVLGPDDVLRWLERNGMA